MNTMSTSAAHLLQAGTAQALAHRGRATSGVASLSVPLDRVDALMRELILGDDGERLGTIGVDHVAAGGRRVRARLALSSTAALGGDIELATGWAAACELLHNASLVHDDLQDGDKVRRGRPTVWAEHGAAQAINVGDLLLMLAYRAIEWAGSDDAQRWQLSRLLARYAEATVRGQALELELLAASRFDRASYRSVVDGKTAALFAMPVLGGALIAGRGEDAAALAEPFAAIGAMYQLQDDVVDLFGDKGRDARGCDLREGKVSALVVEHLRLCPDDTAPLIEILRRPRELTTAHDIDWASERFVRSGALRAVVELVHGLAQTAETSAALRREPALHQVSAALSSLILEPLRGVVVR